MTFPTSQLSEFLLAGLISLGCVVVSTSINYEIMRLVWFFMSRAKRRPRYMINLVVIAIFFGHMLAVWFYGLVYWLMAEVFHFGDLNGDHDRSLVGYVYFSAVTYSSLGFGDVYPEGAFRMIAGVEVLNGLLLIGWSVTLTYFAMSKFWDFHMRRP